MTPEPFCRRNGFTLIEVLVVVAIICVLAAIIIPILPSHGDPGGPSVYCMNNLHQVGVGLYVWAGTHTDLFPFNLSVTNGGSMELTASGSPAPQFQTLSNYFTTNLGIFICPSDNGPNTEFGLVIEDASSKGLPLSCTGSELILTGFPAPSVPEL